jgi:hypothetical protein
MDVPIYVLTSDHYLDALRPFSWLLNKYWIPNPTVIVGGFTPPGFDLPKNFSFHSIGKFEDYPVGKWSNALIKMLLELPHDVFVLMLEDYWLTRPVDAGAVVILADYMRQFEYVARLDLTSDRKNSGYATAYGNVAHLKLIASDPESQYHCSLMCALWRRGHMLKFLIEGESPWEVELNGTSRLRALKNNLLVLGTEDPPVNHTLAFRSEGGVGGIGKVLLSELNPYDVTEMRKLGMLRKWESK